jgi:hypothetical protein
LRLEADPVAKTQCSICSSGDWRRLRNQEILRVHNFTRNLLSLINIIDK